MESNADRVGHRAEVIALIEGAFAQFGSEDVLERLGRAGIPAGRVRRLDEVYAWDQTRSQGLVIDVDHATLGRISLPGPTLRFFDLGADGEVEVETTVTDHRPPPLLDADAQQVRAWAFDPDRRA